MTDQHDHDHTEHEHHHHHEHRPIDYAEAIEGFRADKDAYFKERHGSPIPRPSARRSPGSPTTRSTRRSGSRA